MPVITAAALRQQIDSGELGPLYILTGADEMEKSDLAAQFADTIDEGLRAFNIDRLYGGETAAGPLIDIANTLPMMVPRRLVVVLEAEKLLAPKRETKAAEEEQERLEEFIKAPSPQATVVFVCGSLDKRRRVVNLLLKEAQVVECGTIGDAAEGERWVNARAARDNVKFAPGAARVLVERAGLDIARLRNSFERVRLYTLDQPGVTADAVREVVTPAPDAQENFGISNAIGNGDARGALRQLTAALDAGAQPFFVLGQIRSAAERMPSPRVRAAIEAVFRTDLALKSSGGDPRILLERLVVELCAGGARRSPW